MEKRLAGRWGHDWLLGWRDITGNTNERTVIAAIIPRVGVGNKIPLMLIPEAEAATTAVLAANLAAFVLDYVARQKIGGTTLNYFIYQQLAVLPPLAYESCPGWAGTPRVSAWITPRVLELTYTAWDLQPFAQDCGYHGPPFRWEPERRFLLRCELDAAFFRLYGVAREDVDYILDTFPIVRRNDEKAHGEYRTKRVILEIYDAMSAAASSGVPYATRLDPPAANPGVAHGGTAILR